MKQLLCKFCLFTVIVFSTFDYINAEEIRTTVNFPNESVSYNSIPNIGGDLYCKFYGTECESIPTPGFPDIPMKRVFFRVPTYSNDYAIELTNTNVQKRITLPHPIYPVQESQNINDYNVGLFTEPDIAIYNKNENICRGYILNDFFDKGHFHVVSVLVPMLAYNPYSQSIEIYSSIDVTLKYKEVTRDALGSHPLMCLKDAMHSVYATNVVNAALQDLTLTSNISKYITSGNSYYLIITPENLKTSLSSLVNWKSQKGFTVILKTVEEILSSQEFAIGSSNDSFDKESCVRNWIIATVEKLSKSSKKIDDIKLLLIGDAETSAPIRKFSDFRPNASNLDGLSFDDHKFMPTDIYFSDLVSDFKINYELSNNKFGYLYDQKYQPTIDTGRLLANTTSHISNYNKKLLIYEIDPGLGERDYLNKGFVSRQYQHRNYGSILHTMPCIKDSIVLTDNVGDSVFIRNKPTGEDVILGLGQCGIGSLQGHGGPPTIACAGASSYEHQWRFGQNYRYIQADPGYGPEITTIYNIEQNNSFKDLRNVNKPGIIYTLSCDVVSFENKLKRDGKYISIPYNMASAYTVAGNFGGVAFIGNTRTGWDWENRRMELKFGDNVQKGHSLGYSMREAGHSISSRYAQFTRSLIGDPDIKVWKGSPEEMSQILSDDIDRISIKGKNLANSRFVVYNGNGSSITLILNDDSNITIPKNEVGLNPNEDYVISIFKEGYLPLIKVFASNCNFSDKTKEYFTRDLYLTDSRGLDNYAYKVSYDGVLNLNATRSIKTNKAFNIVSGGHVNLKSENTIEMKSDKIESGGHLNIVSNNVVLEPGFEVEKGGELTINTTKP